MKKNKRCTSKIQELIGVEELVSLINLKAEIERKENRRNARAAPRVAAHLLKRLLEILLARAKESVMYSLQ